MLNGPTQIALTFTDHLDPEVSGKRKAEYLTPTVRTLIGQIESRTRVPVTLVETGKLFEDIVDLNP